MNASSLERLEEIAIATKGFDMRVLVGTGNRASNEEPPQGFARQSVLDKVALHAGHGTGPHTNKSAGITFMFGGGKSIFQEQSLVQARTLKGTAKGRGAMIRFKATGVDIAFIGAYYPPTPTSKEQQQIYLRTCDKITEWLNEVISNLPSQCLPLLHLDLNDGMGQTRAAQGLQHIQNTVINETAS